MTTTSTVRIQYVHTERTRQESNLSLKTLSTSVVHCPLCPLITHLADQSLPILSYTLWSD